MTTRSLLVLPARQQAGSLLTQVKAGVGYVDTSSQVIGGEHTVWK